ncbi:hypothetical protein ACWCQL_13820 [Streptomyces sp. NPDC002073]
MDDLYDVPDDPHEGVRLALLTAAETRPLLALLALLDDLDQPGPVQRAAGELRVRLGMRLATPG